MKTKLTKLTIKTSESILGKGRQVSELKRTIIELSVEVSRIELNQFKHQRQFLEFRI